VTGTKAFCENKVSPADAEDIEAAWFKGSNEAREHRDLLAYHFAPRSATAFPAQGVFSFFPASSPNGNLDCVPRSYHGDFEGLYHQATVRGFVEVIYFLIVNQQLLPNEFLLLEPKVGHDPPFALAQQNNFFYLRLASFHTSSSFAIQLSSFTVGHG
jgi:hypothetical protein